MTNVTLNNKYIKNKYATIFTIFSLLTIIFYTITFYCLSIRNITTYCDFITVSIKNNDSSFLDDSKKKYLLSVAYIYNSKETYYFYKKYNSSNIDKFIHKKYSIVNYGFNKIYYFKKLKSFDSINFIYVESNILSAKDFYYFLSCLLTLILLICFFFRYLIALINYNTKKKSYDCQTNIINTEINKEQSVKLQDYQDIIHKRDNEIICLQEKINKLTIYKNSFLQLNKSKDMFLATITHEIRTPMNGIIGMLDIISQEKLKKNNSHHIAIAKKSAHSLLQMTNDILEYAKLEYSNEIVKNLPIDLNKIIDDICLLMLDQAIKNKTDIIIDVDQDIQDNLIGDKQKINRIITNLVSNAVKNTTNGDVVISLDVVAIKNNIIKIRFTIKDSGIGIKPEDIAILDKPFMQIDSIKNNIYNGSGLGLYITKKLIDLLGGSLSVDAEINKGSKFYFDIDCSFIEKKDNFYFNFYNKLKNKNILVYTQKEYSRMLIDSCFIGVDSKINYTSSISEFNTNINNKIIFDFIIIDLKINDKKETFIKLSEVCMQENNAYIVYIGYFNFNNSNNNINFLQKPLSKIRLLEFLTLGKTNNLVLANNHNDTNTFIQNDKTKCLIVEDDVINQNVLSCMLEELGIINNTIIDNAEDAIQLCKTTNFDILFMDYELPGIKGYNAIKQIREHEKTNNREKAVIISCSAHFNNEEFLSSGANYYLAKPIVLDELKKLLHDISKSDKKLFDYDQAILLDSDRFLEIQKLMEDKFIDFIKLYYKNCCEMLEDIKQSLADDNQELLILTSHKLKSSSSNIGAVRTSNICTELEHLSLENSKDTAKVLIDILEKSVHSTFIECNKYI